MLHYEILFALNILAAHLNARKFHHFKVILSAKLVFRLRVKMAMKYSIFYKSDFQQTITVCKPSRSLNVNKL
ncbi:hypothetical protein AB205_0095230 [Aquarana catesbeiana]|uniref:Uncharacterized protein n=1 Tax=Aquarana catesbeiana TaxID=8400 RepID=A0A2G9RW50_AQUCT|nr:hypothetical protein AB205_0095230 [Aquarana catesbeiana]